MQIGIVTQNMATVRHDRNAPSRKRAKYPIEANVPAVPSKTPRIDVSLWRNEKKTKKKFELNTEEQSQRAYQISLVYVIEEASFSPKPSPITPNAP